MFDVKKTKDLLLKICSVNLQNKYKYGVTHRSFCKNGKGCLMLDSRNNNLFKKATKEVLNDIFIKQYFTEKYIEEKLAEIIIDARTQPLNERRNYLETGLRNLKENIGGDIYDWTFIIPIENIKLPNNGQISIGEVNFFIVDSILGKNIEKNVLLYLNLKKKQINEKYERPCFKEGSVCAEVRIKGYVEKAKIDALCKVRNSLNVLKLFLYHDSFDDIYYISSNMCFGILGEIIKPTERSLSGFAEDKKDIESNTYISSHKSFMSFESLGCSSMCILNKEDLNFLKQKEFDVLNKILKKSEQTFVEKKLLASIYWFGEAIKEMITSYNINGEIKENEKEQKDPSCFWLGGCFLKLVIALEAALTIEKEKNKSEIISERSAYLLARKQEERNVFLEKIKEMYHIRNQIVHQGDVCVQKENLFELAKYVRKVILELIRIKNEKKIETQEELRNFFKEIDGYYEQVKQKTNILR